MKYIFLIWGGLGFLLTLLILFYTPMHAVAELPPWEEAAGLKKAAAIVTSDFANAIMLQWIGGMIFFGFGSLVFRVAENVK